VSSIFFPPFFQKQIVVSKLKVKVTPIFQKKKIKHKNMMRDDDQQRDEVTFKKLFPGLQRSGTQIRAPERPNLRVICFANAGNAEDLFTNEGLGERRIVSPLLTFCKNYKAELLSV
jgi:hypothetical protein